MHYNIEHGESQALFQIVIRNFFSRPDSCRHAAPLGRKRSRKTDVPVRPQRCSRTLWPALTGHKKRRPFWRRAAEGKKQANALCRRRPPAAKHAQRGRGVRKPQKCNSTSKIIQIVNKKERRGIKTPSGRKAAAHGQRLPPHTKIQGRKHPHAAAQGRWGSAPTGRRAAPAAAMPQA